MRELTGGTGVDVVYDGVGKDTFDGSLASLRIRGMLVLFGGASGQVPPFDLQRLNAGGSLFVTRPKLKDHLLSPQERRWRSSELFDAVVSGQLTPGWAGNTPWPRPRRHTKTCRPAAPPASCCWSRKARQSHRRAACGAGTTGRPGTAVILPRIGLRGAKNHPAFTSAGKICR